MPSELPASACYSSPALGRLWKKVHLTYSPFLRRPAVRRLYQQPASFLRRHLPSRYSLIALGCADGAKESQLLQKLPVPASLLAADTNLFLARQAAHRLPGKSKSARQIDLTANLPPSWFRLPRPRLLTLFGVLPNLNPPPLLQRIARRMEAGDLLLLSANLAPSRSGFAGAHRVLSQYDNPPTHRWLNEAIRGFRPRLPRGKLVFGVHPDPKNPTLARIEARWISSQKSWIVLASRRPTPTQVENWIRLARLQTVARFLDPRGEEGLWLVGPARS